MDRDALLLQFRQRSPLNRLTFCEAGTLFDFILATEEGDLVAELREVQFDTHGA